MKPTEAKRNLRTSPDAPVVQTSLARICSALQESGASDQEAACIVERWMARGWLRVGGRRLSSRGAAALHLDGCRAA